MKKSEVFVYISGKYTDEDMLSTEKHIAAAQELAIDLAKADILYFCPHTHSRLMDFYVPEVTWEYWMRCDLTIIKKLCNCMIMVYNYDSSKGALMESDQAAKLGHPIFLTFEEFMDWYNNLED